MASSSALAPRTYLRNARIFLEDRNIIDARVQRDDTCLVVEVPRGVFAAGSVGMCEFADDLLVQNATSYKLAWHVLLFLSHMALFARRALHNNNGDDDDGGAHRAAHGHGSQLFFEIVRVAETGEEHSLRLILTMPHWVYNFTLGWLVCIIEQNDGLLSMTAADHEGATAAAAAAGKNDPPRKRSKNAPRFPVPIELRGLTSSRYMEMFGDLLCVPRDRIVRTAPTNVDALTLLTSSDTSLKTVLSRATAFVGARMRGVLQTMRPEQRLSTERGGAYRAGGAAPFFPVPADAFRISDKNDRRYENIIKTARPNAQQFAMTVSTEVIGEALRRMGVGDPSRDMPAISRDLLRAQDHGGVVTDAALDDDDVLERLSKVLDAYPSTQPTTYLGMAQQVPTQLEYVRIQRHLNNTVITYYMAFQLLRDEAMRNHVNKSSLERTMWNIGAGLDLLARYTDAGNINFVPYAHTAYNAYLGEHVIPNLTRRTHATYNTRAWFRVMAPWATPFLNHMLMFYAQLEDEFGLCNTHTAQAVLRSAALVAMNVEEGRMSLNVALNGPPGLGKTFALKIMELLQVPGTVEFLGRGTRAAPTLPEPERCGMMCAYDELPGADLGIKGTADESSRRGSFVDDMEQVRKTRFTEGIKSHIEPVLNKGDDEAALIAPRFSVKTVSPAMYGLAGPNQAALDHADSALLSRWLLLTFGTEPRADGIGITDKKYARLFGHDDVDQARKFAALDKRLAHLLWYYRASAALTYVLNMALYFDNILPPINKTVFNTYRPLVEAELTRMGFLRCDNVSARPFERMELHLEKVVLEHCPRRTWLDPDAPYYNKPFALRQIFSCVSDMYVTEEMFWDALGRFVVPEYAPAIRLSIFDALKERLGNDSKVWDPISDNRDLLDVGRTKSSAYDFCSKDGVLDLSYVFIELEAREKSVAGAVSALAASIVGTTAGRRLEVSNVRRALNEMLEIVVHNPRYITLADVREYQSNFTKYQVANYQGPEPEPRFGKRVEAAIAPAWASGGRWGVKVSRAFLANGQVDAVARCIEATFHDRTRMIIPGREAPWMLKTVQHELLIEAFDVLDSHTPSPNGKSSSFASMPTLYTWAAHAKDPVVVVPVSFDDMCAEVDKRYPRQPTGAAAAALRALLAVPNLFTPERTRGLVSLPSCAGGDEAERFGIARDPSAPRSRVLVSRQYVQFIMNTRRMVSAGHGEVGFPQHLAYIRVRKNRAVTLTTSEYEKLPGDKGRREKAVPVVETDIDADCAASQRARFFGNPAIAEVLQAELKAADEIKHCLPLEQRCYVWPDIAPRAGGATIVRNVELSNHYPELAFHEPLDDAAIMDVDGDDDVVFVGGCGSGPLLLAKGKGDDDNDDDGDGAQQPPVRRQPLPPLAPQRQPGVRMQAMGTGGRGGGGEAALAALENVRVSVFTQSRGQDVLRFGQAQPRVRRER